MRDYNWLIEALLHCVASCDCKTCPVDDDVRGTRCIDLLEACAADAIEELSFLLEGYRNRMRLATEWISVEERLPDMHDEVLVCVGDYGKTDLGFAIAAVWDGTNWLETWERKATIYNVTHWMPLPDPPKDVPNAKNQKRSDMT